MNNTPTGPNTITYNTNQGEAIVIDLDIASEGELNLALEAVRVRLAQLDNLFARAAAGADRSTGRMKARYEAKKAALSSKVEAAYSALRAVRLALATWY